MFALRATIEGRTEPQGDCNANLSDGTMFMGVSLSSEQERSLVTVAVWRYLVASEGSAPLSLSLCWVICCVPALSALCNVYRRFKGTALFLRKENSRS